MDRLNPTTDLFTLIGMMATVAGILICLFFLFTPVSFGAVGTSAMIDRASDLQLSMRWIQPILGQGIVEDAVIRQHAIDTGATVPLDRVSRPTSGSIQWVLGRVIVELNRSRMVVGLSEDQRIAEIVRHAAQQLQEGFVTEARTAARTSEPHNLLF